MKVQPDQVQVGRRYRPGYRLVPGGQGKAELAVNDTGGIILVGVGVYPRSQAQQDIGDTPLLPGNLTQHRQFLKIVRYDAAHPPLQGLPQLIGRLVIAVEVYPVHGEVNRPGNAHFPAGNHVQSQSLFFQEERQSLIDEGFTGINDNRVRIALAEFRDELGTLAAQAKLIKNI